MMDKTRMASIIARVEKHRKNAKELVKRDIADYVVFNALAMECFQAANSAIELAELIVSEKNLGFPAKYRELFEMLYQAKIISAKTLKDSKRMIFLRNLISHEYYAIKQEELKEMANLLDSLDELVGYAKKMAEK